MIPKNLTITLYAALALGAAQPVFGQQQGLVQLGDRRCTVEGTQLHNIVVEASGKVGCNRYCTVDKSQMREYQDFAGEVFACVPKNDRAAGAVAQSSSGSGLSGGAGGAVLGIALLLGLAAAAGGGGGGDGGGGSTNGTN